MSPKHIDAFTARIGEIEDFAVKIATNKLDVPAITLWLNGRVTDENRR